MDDFFSTTMSIVVIFIFKKLPIAVHFRSASTCLNFIMATLKTSADYYPGRLAKVFVVDPPSMFNYLWKVTNIKIFPPLHSF